MSSLHVPRSGCLCVDSTCAGTICHRSNVHHTDRQRRNYKRPAELRTTRIVFFLSAKANALVVAPDQILHTLLVFLEDIHAIFRGIGRGKNLPFDLISFAILHRCRVTAVREAFRNHIKRCCQEGGPGAIVCCRSVSKYEPSCNRLVCRSVRKFASSRCVVEFLSIPGIVGATEGVVKCQGGKFKAGRDD